MRTRSNKMTGKPQSTYGDDALNRTPYSSSDPAPQRHARTRRCAAAANRHRSDVLENPHPSSHAPANFDPSSSRESLIATAAYYRAESRGFLPGYEVADWLAAEREIDGVGTDPI